MEHSESHGFMVTPPAGAGPGVLVLHAWWGLNETIKTICRRLAEHGFVAYAPDLYHGKVAKTVAEAEVLGAQIDANHQQAAAEVGAAARFVSERAGVGVLSVVALSLGGYYALKLADAMPEHIRKVVLFYATDGGFGGAFDHSRADYLGHFAEHDEYEPPANADRLAGTLRNAGRTVTFYQYPGARHWFFEPDVTAAYDAAAAYLAWLRTLAFLAA